MDLALIVVYVLVNIVIMFIYYKKSLGVFQAPFLMACISLTVILPQFTTIYFHPYYDNDLIYKLGYTMITGNLAFALGFEYGKRKAVPTVTRVLDLGKIQYLTLLFSILGFSTVFLYGNLNGSIDGVIAANLKTFAFIALALTFVTLLQGYRNLVVWLCLIFSLVPIVNYAFFVKGSRGDSLILVLSITLFLSLLKTNWQNNIKLAVLSLLIFGSVLSASISGIRHTLKDEEGGAESYQDISFFEAFTNSFTNSYESVGMDLGNAALGIEYCYVNGTYDYGLSIWNGFVYNYVPKRLVGGEVKANLRFDAGYSQIIPILTNNITTMTGYFSAFASFSFFGFLFFLFLGYLYGTIWHAAAYSNFYKFLYFYTLSQVPLMLTHGFQYVFVNLELIFIFIFPMLSFFIYKKRTILK